MSKVFRATLPLFLIIVLAMVGCAGGEKKVKVNGKLMKNGAPFTPPIDTIVTLMFIPEVEKGQTYPATYKHDTGAYNIELPAGTYKSNYLIVPKGEGPINAPPEHKSKTYQLTKDQELDFEISPK